jgi:hypothetical protein
VTIVSAAPENRLVWEVYDLAPPNGRLPIDLMEIAHKSWHGPLAKFGATPGEYAPIEADVFEDLKKSRLIDKYIPTYFMPDSASYAQSRQVMGDKFRVFDCTISVAFTRLWDGSTSSIDLPCKRHVPISCRPSLIAGHQYGDAFAAAEVGRKAELPASTQRTLSKLVRLRCRLLGAHPVDTAGAVIDSESLIVIAAATLCCWSRAIQDSRWRRPVIHC